MLAAGLSEKISIELVSPGQLPFEDGSFEVVFSKDSIIHIPDKSALASDVYRVLKPGGRFLCLEFSKIQNQGLNFVYKNYSKIINLLKTSL